MATAPVLETSTKPKGCINLINASNFSADPVNSKTKDWFELSITLARKISATLNDSTLLSPLAFTLTRTNSLFTKAPSLFKSTTFLTGTILSN